LKGGSLIRGAEGEEQRASRSRHAALWTCAPTRGGHNNKKDQGENRKTERLPPKEPKKKNSNKAKKSKGENKTRQEAVQNLEEKKKQKL